MRTCQSAQRHCYANSNAIPGPVATTIMGLRLTLTAMVPRSINTAAMKHLTVPARQFSLEESKENGRTLRIKTGCRALKDRAIYLLFWRLGITGSMTSACRTSVRLLRRPENVIQKSCTSTEPNIKLPIRLLRPRANRSGRLQSRLRGK